MGPQRRLRLHPADVTVVPPAHSATVECISLVQHVLLLVQLYPGVDQLVVGVGLGRHHARIPGHLERLVGFVRGGEGGPHSAAVDLLPRHPHVVARAGRGAGGGPVGGGVARQVRTPGPASDPPSQQATQRKNYWSNGKTKSIPRVPLLLDRVCCLALLSDSRLRCWPPLLTLLFTLSRLDRAELQEESPDRRQDSHTGRAVRPPTCITQISGGSQAKPGLW